MGILRRLIGKPDRNDFAQIVMDALRQAGETRPIEFDPEDFKLKIDGDKFQFWLGNAYQEYCASPRRFRKLVLERYLQIPAGQGLEIPSTFEEALPHLLPRVRTRSYYGLNQLRFGLEKPQSLTFAYHPLGDHLAVGVVYDQPESIAEPPPDTFTSWHKAFEEVLEAARENLWKMSRGKFETVIGGVYLSPWRDNHDASRLFLHELLWQLDVCGDYVAAVPNRDTLIVTGSEDPTGLAAMAALIDRAKDGSRLISAIPVVLQGRTWATFQPAPDHPEYFRFNELRIREQLNDYTEQKRLLEAWHRKTGEDVFVANYVGIQKKETGAYSSYCTWAEGIPTLLPQADEVVFVRSGKTIAGKASWNQVYAVLKDSMTLLDYEPKRFRVDTFPTQEQFDVIGLEP